MLVDNKSEYTSNSAYFGGVGYASGLGTQMTIVGAGGTSRKLEENYARMGGCFYA